MTEPIAAGYASWDPRGFYHFHERAGGAFISGRAYLDLLRPSLAGYHGEGGRLQPYGAIAQILGEGIPTAGHTRWRVIAEIDLPTTGIARKGARQYMTDVMTMAPDGTIKRHKLFTAIGSGYDPFRENERIETLLNTGDPYGIEELPDDEQLMEIDRSVTQLDWVYTYGIGPIGG